MNDLVTTHGAEVASGSRFEFGQNWANYLRGLTEERIELAEKSLQRFLGVEHLDGKTFLDIGCGSGIFSLAARRLGAIVYSFDYDPKSAACAMELKSRYFPDSDSWTISEGSALDRGFMTDLGTYDIVYSWGVLHHTGSMWQAIENAIERVSPNGKILISIYNDQGRKSVGWLWIKRTYNRLPVPLRWVFAFGVIAPMQTATLLSYVVRGKPAAYFDKIINYDKNSLRGMSWWHDQKDWLGGLPFEVAKPEQILDIFRDKGFYLARLKTCGGRLGCNEYLFERSQVGA